jgi:hypothetical protein
MENKKKKGGNGKLIAFVVIVAAVCIGYFVWGLQNSMAMIYDIAFHRDSVDTILESDEDYVKTETEQAQLDAVYEKRDEFLAENVGEKVTLTTDVDLSGTFYDNGSDTTVILIHGYNADSSQMAVFAPYYAEKGYNILLTDLRYHGESGGDMTTFGYLEQDDLSGWVDFVEEKLGQQKIILHGFGVGAFTALLTAGERDDISLVVADTPYTTMRALAQEQISKQFSLGICTGLFNIYTESKLQLTLSDVSAVAAVEKTSAPVLFICGSADEFIGDAMTAALSESCASDCTLYEVPNARFGMAYASDTAAYEAKIDEMLP